MSLRVIALAIMASATTSAYAKPMTPARAQGIDAAVQAGMARTGTMGMAIAVIEDGKVVFTKAYGVRSRQGAPLTTDTVMYGASLTKAVVAYTFQRLTAEGKVGLDMPLARMLPQPLPAYGNVDGYGNWGDLSGDDRWSRITPRIILTHSTGFANFAFLEPDQKLKIHFEPGSRYSYSGEAFNLLQFALEKRSGVPFADTMNRLTFGPRGMTRSGMVWDPAWADNAAQGWDIKGAAFEHSKRGRTRAAGSMDTTITDFAKFAAALVGGQGLTRGQRSEISKPYIPIKSASQFPVLQADLPPSQRIPTLGAGLGVETFSGPQWPGFYKGGHNDTTGNMMICLERGRRCMVVLGNDVRVEALFPELTNVVLGPTGTSWKWKYPEMFSK